MKEHGICAKCKKSVGCPYADDRIKGCKKFVLEDELELTNEEVLRQCTTEQLAEWMASVVQKAISIKENNGIVMLESAIWWEEWLKQQHTKGVAG